MRDSKNISELNDCFMHIFSYVLYLKGRCAFETPSFSEVYQQTRGLFNKSAELAIGMGVDIRKYDKARFAVCVWVDEIFSTMSWSHNQQWLQHTLQSEFYGLPNANTAFFLRLNALRDDEYAVREIYLYCLYLGYCGQYLLEGDKPLLKQLKLSQLNSLVDRKSLIHSFHNSSIFKYAYPLYAQGNQALAGNAFRPASMQTPVVDSIIGKNPSRPIWSSLSIIVHSGNKILEFISTGANVFSYFQYLRLIASKSSRSRKGKLDPFQNNHKRDVQTKIAEFNLQWNSCITQVKKIIKKNWISKSFSSRAWYIVIGDKGQGKTSLLQASEALSPVENHSTTDSRRRFNPLGFWLMRDSVILDTPGEMIEQRNDEDTILWWSLLKQLKRFRKKNSVNGIILCISAETLRSHDMVNLQQRGDNIRRRLDEVSDILKTQYPVYVLVTQCNKLDNQEGYFENFPVAVTKQAMGKLYQIPNEEHQLKELIGDTLRYIYEQLNILRLLNLRDNDSLSKMERNFFFPEKFMLLKHGLTTLLHPIFRTDQDTREKSYAYLRGIFFTSVGVQEQNDKINFKKSAGYFLQELFTVVLPADKELLTPSTPIKKS